MAYINIEYNGLYDLIQKFQGIKSLNSPPSSNPNFVIVDETCFQGCYGGIFDASQINYFENKPFVYDYITKDMIIVWWQVESNQLGDMSLKQMNNFVLITPKIYKELRQTVLFKHFVSSYYR